MGISPQIIASLLRAAQGNSSGLTSPPAPDSADGTAQPQADPRVAMIQAAQGNSSGVSAAPASTGGGNVLPATSPFDISSMVRQVANLPEYQKPSSTLEDIGGREKDVEQQLSSLPIPKMGFKPNWAGDMAKAGTPAHHPFLHNLGQALLTLAASTTPGQAVQSQVYGPGIRAYSATKDRLTDQLKALKGEETVPTEQLHALTGLTGAASNATWRSGELELGHQRNDVAKARSNAYAQSVANTNANALQRLSQGWNRLSIDQQKTQAQQWYQHALIDTMQQRTSAGMDENSARIQAQEDVRAALSQNQWAVQHPVMSWLGMSPDIAAAPGAQNPKPIGTTPHKQTKAPTSGNRRVVDLTK